MRDIYHQPDAPDPVLDDETVLSLVRRHVPDAKGVLGVDESGGEARTYAVDDAVILKTQRPHRLRPRTSLEKETVFLRYLASCYPDQPLPIPRAYGYDKAATEHGMVEYVCMSRVPGIAVQRAGLVGPARAAALRALGSVLARVHAVPQAPLVQSGLLPGDRSAGDLAARVEAALAAAVEVLGAASDPWSGRHGPAEVAAAARRGLPSVGPLTLVALHSNPGATHTFVDPERTELTGLIDFGDAYLSHPAFDLVRWPDEADRAALLDGYRAAGMVAVDETFLATWRVASVLADLQAARNPVQAARAAAQLDHLKELL
jgi:aminoglycoside phosphotransferase (APT) family kinase protein